MIVFVEYESEVEEERGRVKALLEKLRIDAQVLVFWLASGKLSTYETIIHGHYTNPETENLVNECLKKEEWWEDLQAYRGSRSMTEAQEFASIAQVMGSTSGRPGLYNPHSEPIDRRGQRRHSLAQLELPRKPSMSQLVKLGVSMGIHTQNLPTSVFDSSDSDLDPESDSDSDSSETGAHFTDAGNITGGEDDDARKPLLAAVRRRRSFADIFASSAKSPRKEKKSKRAQSPLPPPSSYGTMASTMADNNKRTTTTPTTPATPNEAGILEPGPRSRKGSASSQLPRGILKPERPPLSRHSSSAPRFSSNLVPQTTITNEDGAGPRIMFAESDSPRVERPPLSRQSSYGRSTGTGTNTGTGTEASSGAVTPTMDKRVSFAEVDTRSPARSRRSSFSKDGASGTPGGSGDVSLNIPELLASYHHFPDDNNNHNNTDPTSTATSPNPGLGLGLSPEGGAGGGAGSSYSTQGLSLSFNDLPSRAQHLILNELMRQASGSITSSDGGDNGDGGSGSGSGGNGGNGGSETAVMLTTLPIPQENTCQSEEASLAYLSDVEVLCNSLPPILLVLSNHMTVTVSL